MSFCALSTRNSSRLLRFEIDKYMKLFSPERKKKVLVVTQAFECHYTGWAKHTSKLLDALTEQYSGLASPTPDFWLLTSRGEVQSPVFLVNQVLTTPFSYREDGWAKGATGFALVAYLLVTFWRWDLVYCSNFYFPVPILVLLAHALGCRTVVRIAGQEVTATGKRGALRDAASRRADAIVVLNSAVREYLTGIGVDPQTIYQIPNAVNTSKYVPATDADERTGTIRHLLCVAAVCERKGIHHVIEAMAQIRDRTGGRFDLHLTVVGPFNEAESSSVYTERLTALIESHGLEEAVEFTGRVDEVFPYYQEADAFLIPSYEEGMPNVLLEAMACRLPCIATAIPGIVDVVTNEETALLVQPRIQRGHR